MKTKTWAYGVALAVFAAMTTSENLYLKYHPLMTGDDLAIFVFNIEGFLAFIAPGYIAALMIRRNGLISGGSRRSAVGRCPGFVPLVFSGHRLLPASVVLVTTLGCLAGRLRWAPLEPADPCHAIHETKKPIT
jgi:hypothetical protein